MANSFRLFPQLPSELRVRIWQLAVEPRTVKISFVKAYEPWGPLLHVTSPTPVPPVLHSCSEARYELERSNVYQRAFSAYPFPGREPRYIWVSFETDMISIGQHLNMTNILEPEKLLIQRLMMEGENDDSFFWFRGREFREFPNLKKVHIVCVDEVLGWHNAWESIYWPCGDGNVYFIEKESGHMIDGYELDRLDREYYAQFEQDPVV